MGDRVVVLFTDGTHTSTTGVFFHFSGSVVGITLDEIWSQIEKAQSLNECCDLLRKRQRDLCLEWGHRDGSPFIPEIKSLEDDEILNPRLLNCGDEGVLVVNVKTREAKSLRGPRWARTYSIARLAEIQKKSG